MTQSFIHDDFLLSNRTSRTLYHDYAESCPIIDYHNHLDPHLIASNHGFSGITEAWLAGDHYKWRAMRAHGIHEDYITGGRSDKEKFAKWANTVPYTMRNPLYHWTHLELKRYFDLDVLLNDHISDAVYAHSNEVLSQPSHSTQGLLEMMKVTVLCTTDDPSDDLNSHKKFKKEGSSFQMLPGFRPDRYVILDRDNFNEGIIDLERVTNKSISNYSDLLSCLADRIGYFAENGCSVSDHGLTYIPEAIPHPEIANKAFESRLANTEVSSDEVEVFMVTLLHDLCRKYAETGWVMQFHLGAIRNNNSRLGQSLGADAGCDSIGDYPQARGLSAFLDRLDKQGNLPKTILYNLNPADNEVFATMAGNFNDGSSAGKVQWGSAWWFLDQKDGMEDPLWLLRLEEE